MDSKMTTTLKGYEVQEQIGAGGFGAVYRAFQPAIGREVAIKVILPGLADQADFIRRFESEAHLVARLEHPHVTPIYDYWRDPEGAYLVMRWLRGGSLRDALQNGAFELNAAALLLDQVAGALSVAHRNQVIHRDIKPGNILLDEDGNAYLTDFGIAKDLRLEHSHTRPDAIMGSLDYISPEQARGEPITPRTDIYSLGVTLYEVITGHHPFLDVSNIEKLYKHINDPLPEVTLSASPEVVEAINQVIHKATAKNPEQRYPDALAFSADFREAIGLGRTPTNLVELLTPREHEILHLIIEGLSNKEIAQRLTVTLSTVKWYVNQIYTKLGVRSRVQAIIRAREMNLLVKGSETAAPKSIPTDNFHPQNPYKGLQAFQSADYQHFFGRERVLTHLLERLKGTGEYGRFLAIVGPSGSGKSSLVKAGLIPALWRGDLAGAEKWFIVEMLPGARPLDALEIALTKVAANQSPNLHAQLARDAHGFVRAADLILPNDGRDLLLVVDQFEEVFTLVEDEAMRQQFLDLLVAAVTTPRSRIRLVVTLRADFYDRPLQYPEFAPLLKQRLETILPLTAEELERSIAKPAEQVGMTFEPGLVSSIVTDIHYQPGALPLLQYALTELFERRQGRQLTHAAYVEMGGAVGALANRAEQLYTGFPPEQQELTRQMFLHLVTLSQTPQDMRRRVRRTELLSLAAEADVMDELIDTFADYRLLTLDHDAGTRSPTVEVAHEAILREWRRLSNWMNDYREDIKMREQLDHIAQEWDEKGKEVSYLVSGQRLTQFEGWADEKRQALTALERAYLEASIAERTQHADSETKRQQREKKLERRSLTFLRGLVMVLVLALLGAIGLTGVATNQSNQAVAARLQAEDQARIATARELVGYANANLNTDAELSTLLAMQAVNTTYQADGSVLPEANTILHQAVQGLHIPVQIPSEKMGPEDIFNFGYSPDSKRIMYPKQFSIFSGGVGITGIADAITGKLLYEVSGDALSARISPDNMIVTMVQAENGSVLQLWDVSSDGAGKLLSSSTVPVQLEQTNWTDVSSDFRRFFASMGDNQNRIWNLETGQEIITPATQKIPQGNGHPSFSPDGKYLANRNPDATLSILDSTSWEEVFHISPLGTGVADFTFSLDGKDIATRNTNSTVTIWDLTNGAARYTISPVAAPTWIALNANASRLAISSRNGQVSIWDTQLQRQMLELSVSNINGLVLNPDGTQLATIHPTGFVQIWNLRTEPEILTLRDGDPLVERAGIAVAYSPDGQRLVSASDNLTPAVWDAKTGERIFTLTGHTGPVSGAAWSPDGTRIATASADNTAKIWDAETGKELFTLSGHTDLVYAAAFSPNSQFVATSSNDGTVKIWDVANGQLKLTLDYSGNNVRGVAWSSDGQRLAATSKDNGTVRIWNAATGEEQLELPGEPNEQVHTVAFSPDGKQILTGSYIQMNAFVWDAETGQKLLTLSGHTDQVGGVAYSPDGNQIATASSDGTVKLWDASTGEERLTLLGSPQGVNRVAFSPDGKHLATQNFDATTRIYVLDIDELLALAQSRLTRWWTADECQKYLHTDTCPVRPA